MKYVDLIKERLLGKSFKTTDLYGETYAVFDSFELALTYSNYKRKYVAKAIAKTKDGTEYEIPINFDINAQWMYSNVTINFDAVKILLRLRDD